MINSHFQTKILYKQQGTVGEICNVSLNIASMAEGSFKAHVKTEEYGKNKKQS